MHSPHICAGMSAPAQCLALQQYSRPPLSAHPHMNSCFLCCWDFYPFPFRYPMHICSMHRLSVSRACRVWGEMLLETFSSCESENYRIPWGAAAARTGGMCRAEGLWGTQRAKRDPGRLWGTRESCERPGGAVWNRGDLCGTRIPVLGAQPCPPLAAAQPRTAMMRLPAPGKQAGMQGHSAHKTQLPCNSMHRSKQLIQR